MSAAKYESGQEVYDIRGNAYRYIGPCAAGHVAEPVYEADDDEPHYDEPQTLREVFAEPPRHKLAADLSEVTAKVQAKRDELNALTSEAWSAQANRRNVERIAKEDERFADLSLWLDGKATHIVAFDVYSVSYGPIKEMLDKKDSYRTQMRLLGFYVDPDASRYWTGRSSYSDGSARQTPCRLASSEEHALQLAREYVAQQIKDGGGNFPVAWLREAKRLGMPITSEQEATIAEADGAEKKRRIDQARSTYERAAAELRSLEEGAT